VDPAARVRELVEPVLSADGFELVDAQFSSGALQIFVDRPGGIDLDAIAAVSTTVSQLLDEHDPVPGRYTLEVSSPGVERPLRRPEHFARFVGTTVNVKTRPEVTGERRVQGLLEAADDEGVVVAGRRLAYGEIERARTVFEWGPAPKPGSRPGKRRAASPTERAVS
jgi:ribosome maturation factor RimP